MILVVQCTDQGDNMIEVPCEVKGNQVNIPGPVTEFHRPRVICAVTLASTEKPMVVLGRVLFSLFKKHRPYIVLFSERGTVSVKRHALRGVRNTTVGP